jgi:hypothetical protein
MFILNGTKVGTAMAVNTYIKFNKINIYNKKKNTNMANLLDKLLKSQGSVLTDLDGKTPIFI